MLVVEDDAEMRSFLEEELRDVGYQVETAADGREGLRRLAQQRIDVVVSDLIMPGLKGRELLSEVRATEPGVPVVIITAFGSIESAVDSMRAGAFHYVTKPFKVEQLLATIENALQQRRMWQDLSTSGDSVRAATSEIVATSGAMQKALELTLRAAPAASPVLVLGESGTGKELLALALHAASPRHAAPFLGVNCSAIPAPLLESQLFGHRRGAFTAARDAHRGLFREADGGTLLLDEIGDMAPELQAKLLRVLQQHEIQPVGAPVPEPVDVRIVAATHADLEQRVRAGGFRQDLYYRLNVICVHVPALRDRMDDLIPLVRHFIVKHGPRLGKPTATIEADALDALRRHDWPGNVRELENCIERALVLGHGPAVCIGDLPPALRPRSGDAARSAAASSLAELEREHILRTLAAVGGNRAAAARLLAVDRKTLYRKLKQYGHS